MYLCMYVCMYVAPPVPGFQRESSEGSMMMMMMPSSDGLGHNPHRHMDISTMSFPDFWDVSTHLPTYLPTYLNTYIHT